MSDPTLAGQQAAHEDASIYEMPSPTGAGPADAEVALRDRLLEDPFTRDGDIEVAVDDGGTATLTGAAPSGAAKRAAGDHAWETPGVTDVRNEIEIRPGPAPSTGEPRS